MPMLFMVLFFGMASIPATQAPSDPVAVRTNFEAVESRLDHGGDLMVVANLDGVVEDTAAGLRGLADMLPPMVIDKNIQQALDRLPAFITSSGFFAVDGFGMSLVPRGDKLNNLKVFLRRDPAAASLPLWRAMVGGAPKVLTSLDYLPADTVLARTGCGEPDQLWKLITTAVRQVGGPATSKAFDSSLVEAGNFLGTNVDTLVASIGADSFFAVQLSTTQTMPIDMPASKDPAEPLAIPLPGLIVGTAVRDATLSTVLHRLMERHQVPCVTSVVAGVTLVSIKIPEAQPYPFSPTFASHKGMFLFGSTPDAVKASIAAAENKTGLGTIAVFQKAFAGLPMENNGIIFMDQRFTETMVKIQTRMLNAAPRWTATGLMGKTLFNQGAGSQMLVIVNLKDGISISGTTSSNTRQTLMNATLLPMSVAMGSAMAIPSFIRARSYKTYNSCAINLRMLDSAKEQWALEFNKTNGTAVSDTDILQYIKGNVMPICPQGGRYTVGPIGQPPICSHPEHKLR